MAIQELAILAMILTTVSPTQHSTLSLINNAPSDAPVLFYGSASLENGSPNSGNFYIAHVSAINVSNKSILLMVSEINERGATISDDFRDIDDYFFKTDLFQPGNTAVFEKKIKSLSKQKTKIVAADNIKLEIHPAFVQFADGSTWGDPDAGKEAIQLSQRMEVLRNLERLAELYRTKGEKDFLAEFMKSAQPVQIRLLRTLYAEHHDSSQVVDQINSMIRAAESHKRMLKDNATLIIVPNIHDRFQ